MADSPTSPSGQAPAPTTDPASQAQAQVVTPPAEDAEPFDQERALRTIRAQRESEAKLKAELKQAATQLAQFQQAEQAKKDAELTELQKEQKRLTEIEAANAAAQEELSVLRLQKAFNSAGGKLGLNYASPQAADDAFELCDFSQVEIGKDGEVTGLEEALKALQKSRPYLFRDANADAPKTPNLGTPVRQRSTPQINKDAPSEGRTVRF